MRPRGMRDIPTAYGLAKRTKPGSRDEAITELARLEREKARLEREMALWVENQKRTEKHLQRVLTRLAMLEPVIANKPPEPVDVEQKADNENQADNSASAQTWTAIKLEY